MGWRSNLSYLGGNNERHQEVLLQEGAQVQDGIQGNLSLLWLYLLRSHRKAFAKGDSVPSQERKEEGNSRGTFGIGGTMKDNFNHPGVVVRPTFSIL